MTTMNRKSPKENATAREKARKLRDEMESQKMPKPKPVKEASEVTAKLQGLKADYAKHAEELRKPIPPARGSTHPMARMGKGKRWSGQRIGVRRLAVVTREHPMFQMSVLIP